MPMPNFLIIGATKSGTTALDRALKQHPQIYMSPVKEPRFFAFNGERLNFCGPGDERFFNSSTIFKLEDHAELFRGARDHHIAIGESLSGISYGG
ncbi:MAG TPA: hypothetical protein VNM22_11465 [Candidatus Limnocylindrales bacterium]|nr:hypothetical protein [Candidatus Limnocylindrales bacterium]